MTKREVEELQKHIKALEKEIENLQVALGVLVKLNAELMNKLVP